MPLDKSLILGLPAFAGLSGEDADAVLAPARSSRFPKTTEVFAQDEEARHFYLLLSGYVRVVRTTPEGEQIIARYINEGELFGIAVAMGRTTYPASAVAAVDCVVVSWPNSAWQELQSRVPGFGANAYQTIGARLQDTQARVMDMATRQVEQRIAGAVMRLVQQSGRKTGDGVEIDFPISDLAAGHRRDDGQHAPHREQADERLGGARDRAQRPPEGHGHRSPCADAGCGEPQGQIDRPAGLVSRS